MKLVAIVQARMGSERLPGKVLMPIAGKTMLNRVTERTQRARLLNETVVATTTQPSDDAIVAECNQIGVTFYRGSEEDVLDRYYQTAQVHNADAIVRITSDCPLIDPEIINEVIRTFSKTRADYTSNTLPPRTFPQGLDVEVFTRPALERAWREDKDPSLREHVTPYLYRHAAWFRIHSFENDKNYSHMRWTVDTVEDLVFVRKVYEYFGDSHFSWLDVLDLLGKTPQWLEINRHVQQKQTP